MLLGNKVDLYAESEVSLQEAHKFAQENNFALSKEVSAKERVGFDDLKDELLKALEKMSEKP